MNNMSEGIYKNGINVKRWRLLHCTFFDAPPPQTEHIDLSHPLDTDKIVENSSEMKVKALTFGSMGKIYHSNI